MYKSTVLTNVVYFRAMIKSMLTIFTRLVELLVASCQKKFSQKWLTLLKQGKDISNKVNTTKTR